MCRWVALSYLRKQSITGQCFFRCSMRVRHNEKQTLSANQTFLVRGHKGALCSHFLEKCRHIFLKLWKLYHMLLSCESVTLSWCKGWETLDILIWYLSWSRDAGPGVMWWSCDVMTLSNICWCYIAVWLGMVMLVIKKKLTRQPRNFLLGVHAFGSRGYHRN